MIYTYINTSVSIQYLITTSFFRTLQSGRLVLTIFRAGSLGSASQSPVVHGSEDELEVGLVGHPIPLGDLLARHCQPKLNLHLRWPTAKQQARPDCRPLPDQTAPNSEPNYEPNYCAKPAHIAETWRERYVDEVRWLLQH